MRKTTRARTWWPVAPRNCWVTRSDVSLRARTMLGESMQDRRYLCPCDSELRKSATDLWKNLTRIIVQASRSDCDVVHLQQEQRLCAGSISRMPAHRFFTSLETLAHRSLIRSFVCSSMSGSGAMHNPLRSVVLDASASCMTEVGSTSL